MWHDIVCIVFMLSVIDEIYLIVVGIILLAAFSRLFVHKKDGSDKYVIKNEQGAQEKYESSKGISIMSSLQNKVELSWKFLYDITGVVLYKFSKEDQDAVKQVGIKLTEQNMKYQHVVSYGIPHESHQTKLDKEHEKNRTSDKAGDMNH